MKYYQGKMNTQLHALMKAEASLQDKNIPDYINSLVAAELKRRGYDLPQLPEGKPQRENSARMPKAPGVYPASIMDGENAGVFQFFNENIVMLNPYYAEQVGSWLERHGKELTLHVFQHALESSQQKDGSPLVFVDRIFARVDELGIKTVEDFDRAEAESKKQLEGSGAT